MNSNQQETLHNVHLRKAKKAIICILSFSIFSLLTSLIPARITQTTIIQIITIIGMFISVRYIYKNPLFAVIILGIFLGFYLFGWYKLLTGKFIPLNFEIGSGKSIHYFILTIRGIATLIIVGGFYYAVKGMFEKEQFEKKYHTLDEEELKN